MKTGDGKIFQKLETVESNLIRTIDREKKIYYDSSQSAYNIFVYVSRLMKITITYKGGM